MDVPLAKLAKKYRHERETSEDDNEDPFNGIGKTNEMSERICKSSSQQ